MRRLRRLARSASSCSCAAARSASPSDAGEVLEHTSISGQPNSCITSNLRSARSRLRRNRSSGMPSKSRNGWYRSMPRPRSAACWRSSRALPVKLMKSGSEQLNAIKPRSGNGFELLAHGFRFKETVAMDRRMGTPRVSAINGSEKPRAAAARTLRAAASGT